MAMPTTLIGRNSWMPKSMMRMNMTVSKPA